MKCLSITFAVIGLITGIIAAIYWYRSSGVSFFPDWGLPGTEKRIESGDTEQNQLEIDGVLQAGLVSSGNLNKIAALWTAASVVFNCLSAITGALS